MADTIECNEASNLSATLLNNQQSRLYKINEIKEYFIAEIKERELMSKILSKYIASFVYFNKSLIVLSATSSTISISSFETIIGTPVGIGSASLSLTVPFFTGLVKKLLKITINKKESTIKLLC